MILCPSCHAQNLPGALFCAECGAQLVVTDVLKTHAFIGNPSDVLDPNVLSATEDQAQSADVLNTTISLHLVDCGQMLHLVGRNEFTFGRVTEGQPILPDIDLSPYEAYAQGVSRLHASIKVAGTRVTIMDLGSSNGTRVNGQKIIPHVDYPLSHGDIISLGKLKFQILLNH